MNIRAAVVVMAGFLCGPVEGEDAEPVCDVLVIAPHSDDEAIGCTGVILRAVAEKRRVGVVVVTAGDGHVKAAAALASKSIEQLVPADFVNLATLRQRHTLEAMPRLGVARADILFLGYPDGGLKPMLESIGDEPFEHPHTKRHETYGVAAVDYHTQKHGAAAAYLKASLLDDLTEIIRDRKPQEIYTTDAADAHPDHSALSSYVGAAAAPAGFREVIYTFVVHGKPPPRLPNVRLTLTAEELQTKRATIELYQVGVSPVHDYLAEEYARPEERFWRTGI